VSPDVAKKAADNYITNSGDKYAPSISQLLELVRATGHRNLQLVTHSKEKKKSPEEIESERKAAEAQLAWAREKYPQLYRKSND
jgi:hypothetical protein